MKAATKEQIAEIWTNPPKDQYWESPDKIEISEYEDRIEVKLESMYEAPSLNLQIFKRLSVLFETDNINDDDRFGWDGCETCNYGSSYGYTLTIRPD